LGLGYFFYVFVCHLFCQGSCMFPENMIADGEMCKNDSTPGL
jgi:hypothetical protein